MTLLDCFIYLILFLFAISVLCMLIGYCKFIINGTYNNLVHYRLSHEKEDYIWYDGNEELFGNMHYMHEME